MTYELALPPAVVSVGVGRRLVNQALSEWDLDGLAYTATLLTSEILTNSVLHARTPILLTVERAGTDAVRISVQDGSTSVPRRRNHPQDATTGRGLELLDRLAQSWRIDASPEGKTLSFTVGGATDPWADFGATDWLEADL